MSWACGSAEYATLKRQPIAPGLSSRPVSEREGLYGEPQRHRKEQKTKLFRGDRMVLYTDGVVEARKNGRIYGERRLLESLARLKKKYIISPLSNGNVALLTNMAKFAGMPAWRRTPAAS